MSTVQNTKQAMTEFLPLLSRKVLVSFNLPSPNPQGENIFVLCTSHNIIQKYSQVPTHHKSLLSHHFSIGIGIVSITNLKDIIVFYHIFRLAIAGIDVTGFHPNIETA
jgi:hypothetical protein